MPLDCYENASAEACAKAQGWPYDPNILRGSDAPGNVVIGYYQGQFYFRTATNKLYVFLGTPGTDVGWEEISSS